MTFEEEIPSWCPTSIADLHSDSKCYWAEESIKEHTLDKQRVKEAIKHLATTTVECETGCFDDTKEEIIVVKELLKELGLED